MPNPTSFLSGMDILTEDVIRDFQEITGMLKNMRAVFLVVLGMVFFLRVLSLVTVLLLP